MLSRAYTPYIVAFQVLPKVAIIPLLLLWFGFGTSSKVAVAAMFAFFPIVVGDPAGIRSVEPGHRDLADDAAGQPAPAVALIDFPSALPADPHRAWRSGSCWPPSAPSSPSTWPGGRGLGHLAVSNLNQLKVDSLFGVIVLLSLMGLLLHGVMAGLRRWSVPWHVSAA